jgi:branched-chain amino acid transport system substrate-binding protein
VHKKRLIPWAATVLLVVAACGNSGSNQPSPAGESSATQSAEAPAASSDAGTAGESGSEASAAPSGDPIVVGSTLSLTGIFAATGIIHKIAGEEFVDRLNANGGLLGRPVEWKVLDDESDASKVGQLYERLITQDKVDLIIGPYATPNILAAMPVAERHGYILPQHTAVLAPQLTYQCQFPGWSIGSTPNAFVPNEVFDALDSLPDKPSKIALVTSQSGSAAFVTDGYGDDKTGFTTIAPQRGYDVALDVHYPPTTTDWGPLATQIRDANPDVLINNSLGVDTVNLFKAMKQLGYTPPLAFTLFPAPGPLLQLGDLAQGVMSVSLFEPNDATLAKLPPEAADIAKDFTARATEAKVPYPVFETQAVASWNVWQILVDAVQGSGSLEGQAQCDYLHEKGADTLFTGHLDFDPAKNNFWEPQQQLKQIQGDKWVVVWNKDLAAAPLQGLAQH